MKNAFAVSAAMTKATGNGLGKAFFADPSDDNLDAILEQAEANLRALMGRGKTKSAAAKSKASTGKKKTVAKKVAAKTTKTVAKPAKAKSGSASDFEVGDKVKVDGDRGVIVSVSRSTCRVKFADGEIERIPNGSIETR